MFRSAFDDGDYVYSYIPAREKENNFITWMLSDAMQLSYDVCMIMIKDTYTYLLVHCIFISHGKSSLHHNQI